MKDSMIELDSASYRNYIFNIIDVENQFFMVFEISNFQIISYQKIVQRKIHESLIIISYIGGHEHIKSMLKMLQLKSSYKNQCLKILIFLEFFLKICFFSKSTESSKDLNSETKYIIYIHINYNKYIVFLLLHNSISISSIFQTYSLLCIPLTIKTHHEYEVAGHI